ncbi:response regulator [Paenibacillus roseipurpureus]|uniref:Response regulator n=1 Tax=Paenibacillus roseopurpureus TaxID=2918901 RepID=A0AA96LV94_9BACL|nr:response regulator [Paenibacillus sp. MBLB1832]WNR45280.1 response regulator [Paenibacillus sp. MBLB1832]
MYRMVIVDDNPRDRAGLQRMLDWESMGITIVATYEDGAEALEHILRVQPDILVTDVDIPNINGIEMTKQLKKLLPELKIVFMSCHSEFTFVKSAMDLNSFGYILKPIALPELKGVISKVLQEYESEHHEEQEKQQLQKEKEEALAGLHRSLPYLQEQFLRELMFGAGYTTEEVAQQLSFLQLHIPQTSLLQVIIFEIMPSESSAELTPAKADDRYFTVFKLKKLIHSFGTMKLRFFHQQVTDSSLVTIVLHDEYAEEKHHTEILDMIVSVKEAIHELLNKEVRVGLSTMTKELLELAQLYKQANFAVKAKYYSEDQSIVYYSDIADTKESAPGTLVDLQELHRLTAELLNDPDEPDIRSILERALGGSPPLTLEQLQLVAFTMLQFLRAAFLEQDHSAAAILELDHLLKQNMLTFRDPSDGIAWLEKSVQAVLHQSHNSRSSVQQFIVDTVKRMVREQYAEQLTLNVIAKQVNYSTIYANKLFKKETGQTIFDYLTAYRMEKAKELLKQPHSRIYLVAEEVGYTNKSHFCLSFKKHTGLSPTEYKNRYSSNEMELRG